MLGFATRTVIQDVLCIHASERLAYVTHSHHPVMNLSQMDGICFSVAPPSFKHQGQNDFSSMLAEMLEHLNESVVCSPWKPNMAQVIPLSYNW